MYWLLEKSREISNSLDIIISCLLYAYIFQPLGMHGAYANAWHSDKGIYYKL